MTAPALFSAVPEQAGESCSSRIQARESERKSLVCKLALRAVVAVAAATLNFGVQLRFLRVRSWKWFRDEGGMEEKMEGEKREILMKLHREPVNNTWHNDDENLLGCSHSPGNVWPGSKIVSDACDFGGCRHSTTTLETNTRSLRANFTLER